MAQERMKRRIRKLKKELDHKLYVFHNIFYAVTFDSLSCAPQQEEEKKKNKIEEREGKKESVSRRRYEVEGVGKREREKKTGDHLLAKKPSGDLWPWRNQRREEWADARRGKLSAHVSQAADKCATIADKAQNDNTWCACMCVCAGQQLTTFKSQLLLYVVDD